MPGRQLLGKWLPGRGLLGKRLPGWGLLGKRLPGWGLLGKRLPGRGLLGKWLPGRGLLGKRLPGWGLLGKWLPRRRLLGKRLSGWGLLDKRLKLGLIPVCGRGQWRRPGRETLSARRVALDMMRKAVGLGLNRSGDLGVLAGTLYRGQRKALRLLLVYGALSLLRGVSRNLGSLGGVAGVLPLNLGGNPGRLRVAFREVVRRKGVRIFAGEVRRVGGPGRRGHRGGFLAKGQRSRSLNRGSVSVLIPGGGRRGTLAL
jgi:hypothetical protein